jgi:hypothetical protein
MLTTAMTDDDSITLHVDTFAHKLARLKHLESGRHASIALRQLRYDRCICVTLTSLQLMPTMTARPPGHAACVCHCDSTRVYADAVPAVAARCAAALAANVGRGVVGATGCHLHCVRERDVARQAVAAVRAASSRARVDLLSSTLLHAWRTLRYVASGVVRWRLASLDALGAVVPRASTTDVHAVAVCGMKRLQKRRVHATDACGAS